eukprot:TRINITY_DN6039_c0_g1_i5.p1 TRINITY_DN6039_c0_g1~~TRINITY_DN6039_c0_g1_i5.p1  ORF type:complete len:554 (-),score=51.14 TRINITY_DN6039_c0_g1_i5:371-2032(-)
MSKIDDFSLTQVAHVLQGFVNLGWKEQRFIDPIKIAVINELEGAMREAEGNTSEFVNPQDLVLVAWSCADLKLQDPKLMKLIAKASIDRLKNFENRNLGTIVRSFARLGYSNMKLMNLVADTVRRRAGSMKLTTLAKISWGFGTLRMEHRQLYDAIAKALMFKIDDHEMAQGAMLVMLLWSFAAVKYQALLLIEKICDKLVDQVHQLNGEEMSQTIWALGQLDHRNAKLVKTIISHMIEKIEEIDMRHLTQIIQGTSSLRFYDSNLFNKISHKIQQRANRLESKEAATFAWAYGLVGHYDPKTMSMLADRIVEKLSFMTIQELVQCAWGYANLGHEDDNLYEEIQLDIQKKLNSTHSPFYVINGLWAMAVMNKFNLMFWSSMLQWLKENGDRSQSSIFEDLSLLETFHEVYVMCQAKSIGLQFPDDLVEGVQARLQTHRVLNPISTFQRDINRVLKQMEIIYATKKYTDDGVVRLGTVVTWQGQQVVIQGEEHGDFTQTKPTIRLGKIIAREIILKHYGYKMVHFRQRDWFLLKTDQERRHYLKDLILKSFNS